MNKYFENQKNSLFFRVAIFLLIFSFSFSFILPTHIQAQGILNLPNPGAMVSLSPSYTPAIMAGITLYPDNPLQFDFIIDTGDDALKGTVLEEESQKLINYFMAALTVPEDEMWVNLSPHEKDRIIAEGLGNTVLGRDMLAQDYILKQLTASMMYPENDFGKKFWQRVSQKAEERFGTKKIPTNTFNKIWIVPEKAEIYIHGTNVFVSNSRLKVMLEEDYIALEHHDKGLDSKTNNVDLTGQTKAIFREILIPEIEKEVNEGKNFATLRQIYHSMILATWYKNNLKESLLGQVYVNQNKVNGVDVKDKEITNKIYDQYIEAYKKGVYDYIKEDYNKTTQEVIPRKYFSGGEDFARLSEEALTDDAELSTDDWISERSSMVRVQAQSDFATLGDEANQMVGRLRDLPAAERDEVIQTLTGQEPLPDIVRRNPPDENRTKIVATLGPAGKVTDEDIRGMILAGVNVFRINFSHVEPSDYDSVADLIRRIRRIADELERPVAILQDLGGPKIRTERTDEPISIRKGERLKLISSSRSSARTLDGKVVSIRYEHLVKEVNEGERILINDGKVKLRLISVHRDDEYLEVEVVEGDQIESGKGVNLPDTNLSISSVTAKDKRDAQFGLGQKVDFMALSFVRSASDIGDLRQVFSDNGVEGEDAPGIIAKIETPQAIAAIDDIIVDVHGLMVARGDLAVEMSDKVVPQHQRMLIGKGQLYGKPVILATQVLSAMEKMGVTQPSRSDAFGVVTTVRDEKPDAIMLSGETAKIVDSVRSVEVLAELIEQGESESEQNPITLEEEADGIQDMVSQAAVLMSNERAAKAIVVFSKSGGAAGKVSRYRPEVPIVSISRLQRTAVRLQLAGNVHPVHVSHQPTTRAGFVMYTEGIAREIFADQIATARAAGESFLVVLHYGEPSARAQYGDSRPSGSSDNVRVVDLAKDNAALANPLKPANTGGIDFDAGNLKLNVRGEEIQFTIPAHLQGIQPSRINGVKTIITGIVPIPNFPLLLGQSEDKFKKLKFSRDRQVAG